MREGSRFAATVGAVVRRPLVPIAVVALLAVLGAGLALRLEPVAGVDTLVSSSSDTAKANDAFTKQFGDDAVVVLVKGDLQRTMLTSDNRKLIRLEACLSGDSPSEVLGSPLPAVCDELRELSPAKVVFGPGTFLNTSVEQINTQLNRRIQANGIEGESAARQAGAASKTRGDPPAEQRRLGELAREAVNSRFRQSLLELALKYEITGVPSIDKPEFVDRLVFQSGGQVGVPKARFAYLFPSRNSALITMRLRADLSEAERSRTIDLVARVTSEPTLQPERGARYVVSGVPVVVDALANEVQSGIFYLLGAALLVMAATLALVFRTRLGLRLLPLALALAAAAMTFGALSLVGGGLTMATIAVLPVLIGLAVDYAIQSHARFDEEKARAGTDPKHAARAAAAAGGPTIVAAGVATAVGFLVLVLSPVPMVRDFGWLVVAGIAIALVCAFTAGLAALTRATRRRDGPDDLPPAMPRLRAATADLAARVGESGPGRSASRSWHSARLGALERGERALAMAVAWPRRVLAVALAIAVVGWAVDTQTEVVSDVRELVPSELQALKDVRTLEGETGVTGEIDVTVSAQDITRPEVVRWMTSYQQKTLEEAGYAEGDRCQQSDDPPDLCPAFSLPTILNQVDTTNQAAVKGLLDAVPAYFAQGVVSEDRTRANLAFGIRLQPLDDQQRVIERMKDGLDPPKGVSASVVGLPVLAAEANDALASPLRRAATLVAALIAVFVVLFGLGRLSGRRGRAGAREAAVPLIPIALATGWSAGVLFLLGLLPEPFEVDLNPMSVTLGALVIAISTEFSVLLSARYRQEREAGAAPARAMELTYASTGAAVIASGTTAIAGFAALIFSDIQMLRDFGILTVVDLTVSLLGVMLVLPAALIWAEQRRAEKASAEPAASRPYAPTPA